MDHAIPFPVRPNKERAEKSFRLALARGYNPSTKLASCGFAVDTTRHVEVRHIRTDATPRALQDRWPPRTVADVLRWQSALDPRARRKLESAIYAEAKTNANGLVCVIESPKFIYAFGVAYDRASEATTARASSPLEVAYRSQVIPMYCLRIDDSYIAGRNMPGRITLAGKWIFLIGCGTIGGYLAEQLVKAGAGTRGGYDPNGRLGVSFVGSRHATGRG